MPKSTFGERIAGAALAKFDALPTKSKPRVHPNGIREWTPMSAIVLAEHAESDEELLTCVSVATGTKCLPVSSIPKCRGTVLHDSHAEVLALRALNFFLLADLQCVLEIQGYKSRWVEYQHNTPVDGSSAKLFILRPSVSLHMFSTEAPCGDASMGLLINSKAQNDAESWPEPVCETSQLHGRGYFSIQGAVRRKPSRGDAEPTLSKSCTDKLALKQVTSVLAFPTSLFIERTPNAYLKSMILPADKYDAAAFARAFGPHGRLVGRPISVDTFTAPSICHFEVKVLPTDAMRFAFEKQPSTGTSPSAKAGNVSALWAQGFHGTDLLFNETLVNGVKQGARQFSDSCFKTSTVCRKRMWQEALHLVDSLQQSQEAMGIDHDTLLLLQDSLLSRTYADAKASTVDHDRVVAKEYAMAILGGWKRNEGDGDWGL